MIPTFTSNAATARFTYPPASHLDIFPPSPEPQVLFAPQADSTFARPFNIDHDLYNDLLNPEWPLTIALSYGVIVYFLNNANKRRDNKPWAISKSSIFYLFVLLHNLFLAAFSLWTFAGMFHAIRQTWPGFHGENKWAAAADALCKMHGPRGLGSAATFNYKTSNWGFTDRTMKLLDGLPDSTDVGRLWNEGLGFYGWLFYVSKFYEVVDTLIILAKGKNTSALQTFHHAGAMMCMWAGIRYMSPPIWMFVFINSGLHGLMYFYYALTSIEVKVPMVLKRVLTTLQIAQFIFGASYALAHLFIAYDIPVSVPYLFIHNLSSALPSAASTVSSAVASATSTANFSNWLKKAALRAAGEEGLAMNVRNEQGETFGIDAIHAAESEKSQEEVRYRLEYQKVDCLDTSGQSFAILLNVLYLAPLTMLFLQFFVQNYILGTKQNVPPASRTEVAKKAAEDAIQELEYEIKRAVNEQTHYDEVDIPPEVKAKIDQAKSALKNLKSILGDGSTSKAQAGLKDATEKAKKAVPEVRQAVKAMGEKAKAAGVKVQQKGGELAEEAGQKASELKDKATGKAQQVKEEVDEKSTDGKHALEDKSGEIKDEAQSTADTAKDKAQDTKDEASNKVDDAKDVAKDTKEEAGSKAEEAKDTAKDTKEQTESKASKTKDTQQKSKIPKRDHSPIKRDPSPQKRAQSPVKSNASPPGYEAKPKGKENVNVNGESDDSKKVDAAGKDEGKGSDANGTDEPNGLDESAYEINPDELKDAEEEKAEAEMQPRKE